ncbi:MAG: phytoene/squalene synthase family protein [Proteobacteria bacterium]|nr:phytoene/squalene synthase family protein [Pseudomonadota bacterium]
MIDARKALARRMMAGGSRSFWLAAKLLRRSVRDDAAVIYAFCRRADDAVDRCPPGAAAAAVLVLRSEVDLVYSARTPKEPILSAFQQVVRERRIPRRYADELLAGMAMDAAGAAYETVDELLLYCYRVAGTVGLMMCHVMGVRSERALRHAVHLGLAMQLTNICRDVAEDWSNGRRYLPWELLSRHGAAGSVEPGAELPRSWRQAMASSVRELLSLADRFYLSGDQGLAELPLRCSLAVRAARLIYSRIGRVIAARRFEIAAGRAVVSGSYKLGLLLRALALGLLSGWRRWGSPIRAPLGLVAPSAELWLSEAGGRR